MPLESASLYGPFFLGAGPESYYLKRKKKGGSHQSGSLIGVSGNYEKLRDCGIYWSLDGYWATGKLDGKTHSGKPLKSDISEYQIEGRAGYSYTFPKSCSITWVPYAGYGYFCSQNEFVPLSPLSYNSRTNFQYSAGGGMVLISIGCNWNAGFHFKCKFPNEPKCTITDDPDYGRISQSIRSKKHYEIEIPIRYRRCSAIGQVGLLFAPFYHFRHYGGQENHPFDYIDSRFHIWGARLLIQVIF